MINKMVDHLVLPENSMNSMIECAENEKGMKESQFKSVVSYRI